MTSETRIYEARKVITMDPRMPVASHVAVRDGRVLAVGGLSEASSWGDARIDRRFKDKVLMPGLVEGHSHILEGIVWNHVYTGFFDRTGPDGRTWTGLQSIDAVVNRLAEAERALPDDGRPLIGWGFDPIYFEGRRMAATDLDQVSKTRPVIVLHASIHVLNANSVVMERAGIDRSTNVEGVMKDEAGAPNGEMREFAAMFACLRAANAELLGDSAKPETLRRFARLAQLKGVTTVTDLANELPEAIVETYVAVTDEEDFPVRLVPAFNGTSIRPEDGIAKVERLIPKSTEKLRFGIVKLVPDGSIQGFSARLKWPGYYNGAPNGLWNTAPEEIHAQVKAYNAAGLQVHIHTNGDECSEVALDAVEAALRANPRFDHRHTLQHCQMADEAQFRRMAAMDMCVNLFANHLYYWGDQHYTMTLGPDRAKRMDGCATALRYGVPLAIHSDAPITPIGPLFTAWCAVNRQTATGMSLGEAERISIEDSLYAITMGAAITLKMDSEIGSIEAGKRADFAVLEDDPLTIGEAHLKDVRIWGTVLGGNVVEAPKA